MSEIEKNIDELKADFNLSIQTLRTALRSKASYGSYNDSLGEKQAKFDGSFARSMNTFVSASPNGYELFAYQQAKQEISAYLESAAAYLAKLDEGTEDYDNFLRTLNGVKIWDRPVRDLDGLKEYIRRAETRRSASLAPENDVATDVSAARSNVIERMERHKLL